MECFSAIMERSVAFWRNRRFFKFRKYTCLSTSLCSVIMHGLFFYDFTAGRSEKEEKIFIETFVTNNKI
jgi:hypothetical protein